LAGAQAAGGGRPAARSSLQRRSDVQQLDRQWVPKMQCTAHQPRKLGGGGGLHRRLAWPLLGFRFQQQRLELICAGLPPLCNRQARTFSGLHPTVQLAPVLRRNSGGCGCWCCWQPSRTAAVRELPRRCCACHGSSCCCTPRSATHLAGIPLKSPHLPGQGSTCNRCSGCGGVIHLGAAGQQTKLIGLPSLKGSHAFRELWAFSQS